MEPIDDLEKHNIFNKVEEQSVRKSLKYRIKFQKLLGNIICIDMLNIIFDYCPDFLGSTMIQTLSKITKYRESYDSLKALSPTIISTRLEEIFKIEPNVEYIIKRCGDLVCNFKFLIIGVLLPKTSHKDSLIYVEILNRQFRCIVSYMGPNTILTTNIEPIALISAQYSNISYKLVVPNIIKTEIYLSVDYIMLNNEYRRNVACKKNIDNNGFICYGGIIFYFKDKGIYYGPNHILHKYSNEIQKYFNEIHKNIGLEIIYGIREIINIPKNI